MTNVPWFSTSHGMMTDCPISTVKVCDLARKKGGSSSTYSVYSTSEFVVYPQHNPGKQPKKHSDLQRYLYCNDVYIVPTNTVNDNCKIIFK